MSRGAAGATCGTSAGRPLAHLSVLRACFLAVLCGAPRGELAELQSADAEPRRLDADGAVAGSRGGDRKHFWPHSRGHVPQSASTWRIGPAKLSREALLWTWRHPASKHTHNIVGGPLIDDRRHLYVTFADGVRKLSPNGDMLWHYRPPDFTTSSPGSLMGSSLYGQSNSGYFFAVDLETGMELWKNKLMANVGSESNHVEAYDGVVVGCGDNVAGLGPTRVVGLNASDGALLWDYQPLSMLWNFMPVFADDGTFLFADSEGRPYRLRLHTGEVVWLSGAPWRDFGASFTNGGLVLGPNGIAYTCSNAPNGMGQVGSRGVLRTFRLSDGTTPWSRQLPLPCGTWPAVGRLPGRPGLSVVVPTGPVPGSPSLYGYLDRRPLFWLRYLWSLTMWLGDWKRLLWWFDPLHRGQVLGFDAETGSPQGKYEVPPLAGHGAKGNLEGFWARVEQGNGRHEETPSWSSPVLAGDGTVYAGFASGRFYALGGWEGAAGPSAVSSFDVGAAFLPPGPAFAPGLMGIASFQELFVFRV